MSTPTLDIHQQATVQGLVAPHLFAESMSEGRWSAWGVHDYVGWAIAETIATPGGRLVINLPPGIGKTELASIWTPVWLLEIHPEWRLILGNATNQQAQAMGGRVRDEFANNPRLTTKLKDDTTAKGEWKTTCDGGMVAVGVGKAVIGRRANVIVIDDPYGTWAESQSSTVRNSVAQWLTGTITNRLEPNGRVIIVNHRMHPKDLTNYVLSGPDGHRWKHISLPAIALAADPMGRQPGEALCPERYTAAQYETIRVEARHTWQPMYQQNPEEGAAGAVYHRFGQRNIRHDLEIRPDLPVCAAIDWNLNPGMHILIGQHDQMADRFSVLYEIHGPHMAIDGAAKALIEMYKGWRWNPELQLFGDATGVSMTDGKSYGTAMRKHLTAAGIRFRDRIPGTNPGVIESVLALNDVLADTITGEPRYFVHPRCERLIRDFREVMPDDEGKPDKDADPDLTHASDTQRYWVHYLRPLRSGTRKPAANKAVRPRGFVYGGVGAGR